MRQTLIELNFIPILHIQSYKKSNTENIMSLMTTVNFGSAMHPHMADQAVPS